MPPFCRVSNDFLPSSPSACSMADFVTVMFCSVLLRIVSMMDSDAPASPLWIVAWLLANERSTMRIVWLSDTPSMDLLLCLMVSVCVSGL